MNIHPRHSFLAAMHKSIVLQLMKEFNHNFEALSNKTGINSKRFKGILSGHELFTDEELKLISTKHEWTNAVKYLPSDYIGDLEHRESA